MCWWVFQETFLLFRRCSLGIVVVVPGDSGNTSGDGLGRSVFWVVGEFRESLKTLGSRKRIEGFLHCIDLLGEEVDHVYSKEIGDRIEIGRASKGGQLLVVVIDAEVAVCADHDPGD